MSLQFLHAFKFYKKDTFLHKLDPRAKLLFALIYTVSALMFTEIVPLMLILCTLLPLILIGKLFKEWMKSMRSLSYLFLIIIILNTLFISLSFAIAMILRISIMISSFSIFFLTVDPNDLALSFVSMKVPYEYAFSFSLAFRFVPTIANEAQNIIEAQQSRGYEMQESGIVNQIKNLFPLLVPLIVCSIKRAFNVAEALESRAFGSSKERTFYYTIKYSVEDWIFTGFLILLFITLILLRMYFNYMPGWFTFHLPI